MSHINYLTKDLVSLILERKEMSRQTAKRKVDAIFHFWGEGPNDIRIRNEKLELQVKILLSDMCSYKGNHFRFSDIASVQFGGSELIISFYSNTNPIKLDRNYKKNNDSYGAALDSLLMRKF